MHVYPENLEVFVREHWTRELAAAVPFRSFIDEPGAKVSAGMRSAWISCALESRSRLSAVT
jgi:hypothetical protein